MVTEPVQAISAHHRKSQALPVNFLLTVGSFFCPLAAVNFFTIDFGSHCIHLDEGKDLESDLFSPIGSKDGMSKEEFKAFFVVVT